MSLKDEAVKYLCRMSCRLAKYTSTYYMLHNEQNLSTAAILVPDSRMPDATHSKTRRRALPGDKLPMPPSQHSTHFSTSSSSIYTHTHTAILNFTVVQSYMSMRPINTDHSWKISSGILLNSAAHCSKSLLILWQTGNQEKINSAVQNIQYIVMCRC